MYSASGVLRSFHQLHWRSNEPRCPWEDCAADKHNNSNTKNNNNDINSNNDKNTSNINSCSSYYIAHIFQLRTTYPKHDVHSSTRTLVWWVKKVRRLGLWSMFQFIQNMFVWQSGLCTDHSSFPISNTDIFCGPWLFSKPLRLWLLLMHKTFGLLAYRPRNGQVLWKLMALLVYSLMCCIWVFCFWIPDAGITASFLVLWCLLRSWVMLLWESFSVPIL